MKAPLTIPSDTIELQAKASDPRNSVWVSANAGSGKTHVLSQRVTRLLLEGTEPSKILCLTYTRAAAANMANRVFGNLARWTLLDDAELARSIEEIEGKPPRPERLARACVEEVRDESLFTATPIRLVGSTGAPAHPLAIF